MDLEIFFTVVKDKPVCLICNEAVAVFKEYNIFRHFTSKHKNSNYEAMSEYERKQNVENLYKKLSGRQNFFKKVNTIQEAATHASYIVAYNIAKNNKAPSDGEFVKQCMLEVCDVLCPDKTTTLCYTSCVILLHCVIHQDAVCKSALNMKPVLDAVVKLVNTIRSRELTHRQFRDFLQSVQSEYSDVLYYTKVRWLSAGCVFEQVWQLKDDIVSFFHEKQCSAECEMLEDREWLSNFAFFTDLLCHMNNLNVKMQGKNQFIDDIWAHLKAFKLKFNLFAGQLAKNNLSYFSRLNSIPSVNEEKLKNYEDGLKKLHFEFERRFQDFSAIQIELDNFYYAFQRKL
ncbi:General transcription factor II-I repeat domain-containing protein 2B [Araneus ventricosus]|uniref:General transcription factor II-I repeat domain-containing protein 2B n=1 Tax=Araneus ventricosus TaxID=182803 RepID=A0A4Y2R5J0_ARAVE|nr:General transcription factor II-I repeat domain-containing protein 2B [Araneus ventricosus]